MEKLKSLFSSLRVKIIGGAAVVLVITLGISSFSLYSFQKKRLKELFTEESNRLNHLIAVTLEQGMLDNDLSALQEVVDTLHADQEVMRITIANKHGRVKVSSHPEEVGRVIDRHSPTCQICHRNPPQRRSKTVVFRGEQGEKFFRDVRPIFNQPRCHRCHDPQDRINGVLITDFSMADFDRQLATMAGRLALWTLATVGGMIVVVAILMDRMVIRRVSRFLRSTKLVAEGNLQERVSVGSNDEIGELERSFNQMTENLQESMRELNASREYLENLIDSIGDEIVVIDRDYRIVGFNSALLARVGRAREEIQGRRCHEVYYGESEPCPETTRECPVRRTFRSSQSTPIVRSLSGEEGTRHLEVHSSPVLDERGEVYEVVKVSRDVTWRRRLEEQLVRSDKLISLGRLAGGVAHQINNPVGIIISRIDCLRREAAQKGFPSDLLSDLNVLSDCAWRISEITRHLLTFSKESPLRLDPADVNDILKKSVALARLRRPKGVQIVEQLAPSLPSIVGDANTLEQAIVNIIDNALDAFTDGEGTIRIESRLTQGGQIEVVIADNGQGIPEENLSKIFDPFFTTKEMDKGTGLGLSISYGIIQEHQGSIEVNSVVGRGTTFTVTLPVFSGKSPIDRRDRTSEEKDRG